MENKKLIVIISNPFGFGPISIALAVIEQLVNFLSNKVDIIYAASDKCLEPLDEELREKIKVVKINERDSKDIKMVLANYNNPLVIVCLNRIAINTAKDLRHTAFFIDPLTWLWQEIPKDYLKANIYYAWDIFNAREKVKNIKNAKLISPTLGKLPKARVHKKNLIMIYIGGFTNPLVPGFSKNYLIMLSNAINNFIDRMRFLKMIVTGGSEPLSFLKKHVKQRKNIIITTFSRKDFISTLNKSNLFVTTPGLTATLEAFTLKTPISFLPPTNLSQWRQLRLFTNKKLVYKKIEWENYCLIDWNFNLLTEKEAIYKFNELADVIYNDNILRKKFEKNIVEILLEGKTESKKNIAQQNEFIQKIGTNGERIVAKDIDIYLRNR